VIAKDRTVDANMTLNILHAVHHVLRIVHNAGASARNAPAPRKFVAQSFG
jgi:hypothetical protein